MQASSGFPDWSAVKSSAGGAGGPSQADTGWEQNPPLPWSEGLSRGQRTPSDP